MLVTAYTEDALKSKLSFFFLKEVTKSTNLSPLLVCHMMESSGSKLIFKKSQKSDSHSLSLSHMVESSDSKAL